MQSLVFPTVLTCAHFNQTAYDIQVKVLLGQCSRQDTQSGDVSMLLIGLGEESFLGLIAPFCPHPHVSLAFPHLPPLHRLVLPPPTPTASSSPLRMPPRPPVNVLLPGSIQVCVPLFVLMRHLQVEHIGVLAGGLALKNLPGFECMTVAWP